MAEHLYFVNSNGIYLRIENCTIRRWNEKKKLHKKTANKTQIKWMKQKKKENKIEKNCEKKTSVHQSLLLKTKGLHAHFIWKFFPIYLNEAHYLILFRFIFHIYRIHFFLPLCHSVLPVAKCNNTNNKKKEEKNENPSKIHIYI